MSWSLTTSQGGRQILENYHLCRSLSSDKERSIQLWKHVIEEYEPDWQGQEVFLEEVTTLLTAEGWIGKVGRRQENISRQGNSICKGTVTAKTLLFDSKATCLETEAKDEHRAK